MVQDLLSHRPICTRVGAFVVQALTPIASGQLQCRDTYLLFRRIFLVDTLHVDPR